MDQLQTRLDALEQQVHPGNNIFITGANLHLGPIPTSILVANSYRALFQGAMPQEPQRLTVVCWLEVFPPAMPPPARH
jgi:hypothetical protein